MTATVSSQAAYAVILDVGVSVSSQSGYVALMTAQIEVVSQTAYVALFADPSGDGRRRQAMMGSF